MINDGTFDYEFTELLADLDRMNINVVAYARIREFARRVHNKDKVDPGPASTGDNIAATMANLVTPRQLVALRSIAHDKRVDAETECIAIMKCKPEELNKRAASRFIKYLLNQDRRDHQRSATHEL